MRTCVDQDMCIGCGLCTAIVPDMFQMNADGKAEAYAESDDIAAVQEAIDGCPAAAISEAE